MPSWCDPFWGRSHSCIPLEGPLGWKVLGGLTQNSGNQCWHSAEALSSPRGLSASSRLVWAAARLGPPVPRGQEWKLQDPSSPDSGTHTTLLRPHLLARARPRAGPDSRGWSNRQLSLDEGRSKAKGRGHRRVEVTGAITVMTYLSSFHPKPFSNMLPNCPWKGGTIYTATCQCPWGIFFKQTGAATSGRAHAVCDSRGAFCPLSSHSHVPGW